MMWVILLLFLLTVFLLSMYVLQSLLMSNKRLDNRMKTYLTLNDKKTLNRKNFNLLVQLKLYKQSVRDQVLTKKKSEKLEQFISRSGIPLKPEEYVLFQWIFTAIAGGLMYLLAGKLLFLFIGCILGYLFPKWYLKKKQQGRLQKFNDGLPDMISTIIGSLRAGFSFNQALKAVVEEAENPIRDEIDTVLKEIQYGANVDDALNQLKERMPSEDLDLMIQAILIQKQVGGNLATVLDTIVQTIRDRNKIGRQVQTLTAQGRLSGIVIGLLPIVLGLVIYMIQPDYIGTFFTNPIGTIMLIGGAVSGTIGFVLIRKLTTIEV